MQEVSQKNFRKLLLKKNYPQLKDTTTHLEITCLQKVLTLGSHYLGFPRVLRDLMLQKEQYFSIDLSFGLLSFVSFICSTLACSSIFFEK